GAGGIGGAAVPPAAGAGAGLGGGRRGARGLQPEPASGRLDGSPRAALSRGRARLPRRCHGCLRPDMTDEDMLRIRFQAAGADFPDELLALIGPMVQPLLATLDALATLDVGTAEPFVPARQLVDDAG